MKNKKIRLFDRKEECCGCTACASICNSNAITMLPDEEGFLYPSINYALCKSCGLCVRICPQKK